MSQITQDKEERKAAPLARGFLDYFPAAAMGVAQCSLKANEQHNPGEELHWARDKSNDHADCILRHLIQRNEVDDDGIPHVVKVAWRAMALAQEWYEAQGASPGYASRFAPKEDIYEGTLEHERSVADNLPPSDDYYALIGDVVQLVVTDDSEESAYLGAIGVVTDHDPRIPDVTFEDGRVLVLVAHRQLRLVKRGE